MGWDKPPEPVDGWALPSADRMEHCRVIGTLTPGVPDEMETEIVTTVEVNGEVKYAFKPGGVNAILPSLTSHWMVAFGGMTPSRASGTRSPALTSHISGRILTKLDAVAGAPQPVNKNDRHRVTEMKREWVRCMGSHFGATWTLNEKIAL
jgi:hypothetical protein